MNVTNFNVIPPPSHAATDLNYEAELKVALDPVLDDLLDRTAAAGWDRRKAAYTIMFLAARKLSAPCRAPEASALLADSSDADFIL
ncbi:MAG: hypothetical protein EOS32_01850 [Mesorhizobium sp.]|uniref:hypothetical protein n=1 Tax=unclassified Mesorhizobium TaxID=325217 RepID=UPI000FE3E853|nr:MULTISPECIES: hypothetical protein [unclassified Mesorhizobium]RWC97968.1 MAG: hypothetical protein EOS32_01850 [Mesorhizobium sp.]RWX71277.1 hypothetical protein EN780_00655 [Mesorhizobium sp. M4B.F.Ca.ET.089.01.1.1]